MLDHSRVNDGAVGVSRILRLPRVSVASSPLFIDVGHLPARRRCRVRNLYALCWAKRAAGESSALPRRRLASPPFSLHEHGRGLTLTIATAPAPSCRCARTAPTAWTAPRACRAHPHSNRSPARRAPRQRLRHPRHPLPFASTLLLASECQLMPRMAAATTAARASYTRMVSSGPTAPTAACANQCHCRQPAHSPCLPARAAAWRRASMPMSPTAAPASSARWALTAPTARTADRKP